MRYERLNGNSPMLQKEEFAKEGVRDCLGTRLVKIRKPLYKMCGEEGQ